MLKIDIDYILDILSPLDDCYVEYKIWVDNLFLHSIDKKSPINTSEYDGLFLIEITKCNLTEIDSLYQLFIYLKDEYNIVISERSYLLIEYDKIRINSVLELKKLLSTHNYYTNTIKNKSLDFIALYFINSN